MVFLDLCGKALWRTSILKVHQLTARVGYGGIDVQNSYYSHLADS